MATYDKSLTAEHISSNLANYEAARSAFFVLVVHDLDNLVKPNYSGENPEETDYITDAGEALRLNVVKSTIPHFSVATEEYRRGNEVVKFATIPTWDGGSITVDDVVGMRTKDILVSWLYKAYNPHTRKGGRMTEYKKSAQLIEYTQDYEQIRVWNIQGMFITKLTDNEFDRENDGRRQIGVEFVFDRATMDIPEEEVE